MAKLHVIEQPGQRASGVPIQMVGPIISKGLFIKGHHDSMTAEGLPDLQASMDDIALRTMKYLCPFCAKPFPSKGALAMHERVHTGEKPFECEVCHKRFSTKGNMKAHMLVHAKEQLLEIQNQKMMK